MEIRVGDRIAQVELVSKDDNQVKILIDDKLYELDLVMAENGVCSIVHNGRSYNAELTRSESGKQYTINTYFSSFPVEIIDNRTKYMRNRKKEGLDDDQDQIVSQMPGKVVKILVKEGDEVVAGQSVIVVEAMKMQNEYKVGRDCIIKKVLVAEGESISSDHLLIVLI